MAPNDHAVLTTVLFHGRVTIDLSLLEFGEPDLSPLAIIPGGDVQRCELPQLPSASAECGAKRRICFYVAHVSIERRNAYARCLKY